MTALNLANFTLLNTRPANQATTLNALVVEQGGTALSCPSLQIVALAQPLFERTSALSVEDESSQDAQAHFSLESLLSANHWVFISVNAVHQFADFLASQWSQVQAQCHLVTAPRVYAIGEATAKALLGIGLPVESAKQAQFDSESLLASEAFQALNHKKVLIFKGLGGRETLAKELKMRGAWVGAWSLYERQAAPWCAQVWQAFSLSPEPILLFSSQGSFEAFRTQLNTFEEPGAWQWVVQQKAVVFSQRIKAYCVDAGWVGSIEVVPIQSDLGVLQAINRWLESVSL